MNSEAVHSLVGSIRTRSLVARLLDIFRRVHHRGPFVPEGRFASDQARHVGLVP